MSDNLPIPPSSTAKSRAADLALLAEDVRRFTVREKPATDSLWLALLKPRDTVLREYREALAAWAIVNPDAPQGFQDHLGRPLGQGPSAIEALANTVVAKAILGDMDAVGKVHDRIEGRPGQRKLDDGEHADRATMVEALEDMVRDMNDRANERAAGKAVDVTPPKKPNGHANGSGAE